jgi:hypothetical protein
MRLSLGIIPIASVLLILCSACDEVDAPNIHQNRWIYYGIGGSSSPQDAGLYRFDMVTSSPQELDGKNTEHVTAVAKNGIVLYRTQIGSSTALYGYCEDGSIIPVPFPVSEDPKFVFSYSFPPQVTLSSLGHHAVYPVTRVLKGVQNPTHRAPYIVRFNCAKWEMNLIPADSIIASAMHAHGATRGMILGDEVLISGDGSTVWFSVAGLSSAATPDTVGYALLEWKNGAVSVLRGIANRPYRLEGYNEATHSLFFSEAPRRLAMNILTRQSIIFPVDAQTSLNSRQFCVDFDVMALWENEALTVRKCSDGSIVYPLVTLADIENRFGTEYLVNEYSTISIAADGKWIAFALSRMNEPQLCDLFAIRGNGTEIFKVAGQLPQGIASISAEMHE